MNLLRTDSFKNIILQKKIMRFKTVGRIHGTVGTFLFGMLGAYGLRTLSDIDYNVFLEDHPLEQRILMGMTVSAIACLTAFAEMKFASGVYDLVHGTKDYIYLRVLQKTTRNEDKKKMMEGMLEHQLKMVEKNPEI